MSGVVAAVYAPVNTQEHASVRRNRPDIWPKYRDL